MSHITKFVNYKHINRNIYTNIKFLFKTSHAVLIVNRNFTSVFMFPFMFVICKLPNVGKCKRTTLLELEQSILGLLQCRGLPVL